MVQIAAFIIGFLVGLVYQIVKAILGFVMFLAKVSLRGLWRFLSRHTEKEVNP